MKLTNKELAQIIRESLLTEERYDCIKDYMAMGYSRSEAYKECPPDEDDDDDDDYESSYGRRRRSSYRSPKKTSYVGTKANADQIEAVKGSITAKPSAFLKSILGQLEAGRGLSGKQKNIVKSILAKTDPNAVSLFERIIRKRTINENKLFVQRGLYGHVGAEDESKEYYSFGEMVKALIDSKDDDIFFAPQGADAQALQKLLKSSETNEQGTLENWDASVFPDYYNVDPDRVIRLYARLKNLEVEEVEVLPSEREVGSEFEDENDGEFDFESYYS